MSTREHTKQRIAIIAAVAAGATAAVALAAVGCEAFLKQGDVSPQSVEQKAHTLTQQTLDAIRPAVGFVTTSVDRSDWQKCPTETPGQHRFLYTYTLNLTIPARLSGAVMRAATNHFTEKGYLLDPTDGQNTRAGATVPKSTWTVRLGVKNDSTTVIETSSDCVFTTHDPPTTTSSS